MVPSSPPPSLVSRRNRTFDFRLQVLIAWAAYNLCSAFSADDSSSLLYRIVKRVHIFIHIIRCFVGMYISLIFAVVPHSLTRVHCSYKCFGLSGDLKVRLQKAVSMNKRRFVDTDNGFNLDLTYVCDRLIVMAIPCVDSAMYRNDIREVARFFATRHYGIFKLALA